MKKSKYTDAQIVKILKEVDSGVPVSDITRKYNLGTSTIYKWRQKYGGIDANELKRLKQLEEENRRLKEIVADQALNIKVLDHVIKKY